MGGKGGIKGRKGKEGTKERAPGGRKRDWTHEVGGKAGTLGVNMGKGHKGVVWVTGTRIWQNFSS